MRIHWAGGKPAPPAELAKLYAVAVGVDTDPNAGTPSIAAQDAAAFLKTLQAQSAGLWTVHTTLLQDQQATHDAIIDALGDLEQVSFSDRDLVVIYLSGHGIGASVNDYCFWPSDGDLAHMESKAVHASDLTRIIGKLPCRVVLFLDTCHAGGLHSVRTLNDEAAYTSAINQLTSAETGAAVFASCQPNDDSQVDTTGRRSFFLQALQEGLQGKADPYAKHHVTIRDLDGYLYNRLPEITTPPQEPDDLVIMPTDFPITTYTVPPPGKDIP